MAVETNGSVAEVGAAFREGWEPAALYGGLAPVAGELGIQLAVVAVVICRHLAYCA